MDTPTVYLYDGSFEGLLCAVARAVKSGRPVKGIYPERGFSPQLFDTVKHTETDHQQASRLMDYLKNVTETAARFAINGFLSEDREVGLHLYRLVSECLARGACATRLYSHDSVRYLERLSRRVEFEAHKFTGLLRFRIFADGLQYAPFEPDCNVIGYCAAHFVTRLKNQQWILHDTRRDQALYWNGAELKDVEIDADFTAHVRQHGEVADSYLTREEHCYQGLWKSFHRVIANADRHNPGLQRQFMPRRYWKYLVEMQNCPAGVHHSRR